MPRRRRGVSAVLLLVVIAVCCACQANCSRAKAARRARRLRIRDIPQPQLNSKVAGCNNTAQGRSAVTDDRGFLCSRDDFDSSTGCCNKGDQYSCKTCLLDNKCCQEFEQCVSCCLSPQYDAATIVTNVYRSAGRPETGRWNSAFEYCRGKCRTTSRSTVHENAYLDTHHHCFSESGKPTTPGPPTPKLPAGVTVTAGAKGLSCKAACEALEQRCSAEQLPALNNCNLLREHFACEAGCEMADGPDQPAYVVSSAPKAQRPTICLTNNPSVQQFSCDGSQFNTQRLCPCVPVTNKA